MAIRDQSVLRTRKEARGMLVAAASTVAVITKFIGHGASIRLPPLLSIPNGCIELTISV